MKPIPTPALKATLMTVALVALSGCDMLGIESASQIAARKESEGRAIGGACRHAGRAIEECYSMNRRADKAAIFAGWCSSVFRPCRSPTAICTGIRMAPSQVPTLSVAITDGA